MAASFSRRRFRLRPRVLAWLLVAIGPAVLSIGIPGAMMWRAGEFLSQADQLEDFLKREPVLMGLAYKGGGAKDAAFRGRKWDVVAVGTSRVLQFRQEFFRAHVAFFNAGLISNLEGLPSALEGCPAEHLPRVILLGLDQYFFNEAWAIQHLEVYEAAEVTGPLRNFADNLAVLERCWRTVWVDVGKGKIRPEFVWRDDYRGIRLIGLTAREQLGGVREDGSYRYGRKLAWPEDPGVEDFQFLDTFDRIAKSRRRFEYGTEVYPRSLELLDAFLTQADALGIEVIGFLPPYANVVWDRMMSMGDDYEYLRKVPSAVGAVFQRHGMKLYDFSALRKLGAGDEEALDGFHAGEKAMARATVLMARDHEQLRAFVDPDALQSVIEDSPDSLEIFTLGRTGEPGN